MTDLRFLKGKKIKADKYGRLYFGKWFSEKEYECEIDNKGFIILRPKNKIDYKHLKIKKWKYKKRYELFY